MFTDLVSNFEHKADKYLVRGWAAGGVAIFIGIVVIVLTQGFNDLSWNLFRSYLNHPYFNICMTFGWACGIARIARYNGNKPFVYWALLIMGIILLWDNSYQVAVFLGQILENR